MTTDDRIDPARYPRPAAAAAVRAWVADTALPDGFVRTLGPGRRALREAAANVAAAEAAAQARPRKGQRAADALRAFATHTDTPPDDAA